MTSKPIEEDPLFEEERHVGFFKRFLRMLALTENATFRQPRRKRFWQTIGKDPPCEEERQVGFSQRWKGMPTFAKSETLGKSTRNERLRSIEEDPPHEEEHHVGSFKRFCREISLALDKRNNDRKMKLKLPPIKTKDPSCVLRSKRFQQVAMLPKGMFPNRPVYVVKDVEKSWPESYYILKFWTTCESLKTSQGSPMNEKNALQALAGNPFIISFLGEYQLENSIYFVTDFAQGGTLMSYIGRKVLSNDECVFFSANIVSALSYVHDKGFVHRDVRPENFLIGSDGYLKLCDFRWSKRLPSKVHLPCGGTLAHGALTCCGAKSYMAPEVAFSASLDPRWITGYRKSADWWALGCIIAEMYYGYAPLSPFGDREKLEILCLIGSGKFAMKRPANNMKLPGLERANEFIEKLMTIESKRLGRNGSWEVRKHEYFSQIDFKKIRTKKLKAPFIPREWELLFPSQSAKRLNCASKMNHNNC